MTVSEHAVHDLEIVTQDVGAAVDVYGKAYGRDFEPEAPCCSRRSGDASVSAEAAQEPEHAVSG
jgi:hypothetical protein